MCFFFEGRTDIAEFFVQRIEDSSCFFMIGTKKIKCLKLQKDSALLSYKRIQSKNNKQIRFEVFFTAKLVLPKLLFALNPADTREWIDRVISHLQPRVDHPFDNIYFGEKLELTERKSTLKIPRSTNMRKHEGILFYLSTFNSTYGRIQLDIHVEKDPCCRHSFLEHFQASYTWKKNVSLSKDNPGYLVSLPDFQSGVKTTLSTQQYDGNLSLISFNTLKVYWLHNIYHHQLNVLQIDENICSLTLPCIKYDPTLNYIENKFVSTHHYIYVEKFGLLSSRRKIKISWNEASKLCQDMNGTLPVLRSKEQQDEIISILSSANTPPPIMVMFIGMTFSLHSKMVRNIIDNFICNFLCLDNV